MIIIIETIIIVYVQTCYVKHKLKYPKSKRFRVHLSVKERNEHKCYKDKLRDKTFPQHVVVVLPQIIVN